MFNKTILLLSFLTVFSEALKVNCEDEINHKMKIDIQIPG